MKKIFYLTLLSVMILTTSCKTTKDTSSQEEVHQKMSHEEVLAYTAGMENITKRLDLSKEQAKEFYRIGQKYEGLMSEVRSSGSDGQKIREELISLRKKKHKELKKLLNDDQAAKFDQMNKSQ